MRILRAAAYRRMPWKNGGGETVEMIVAPDGASFDAFDWRLSMAHVGAPGPFSQFPGIDRTLSVIQGHGLMLKLPSQDVVLDRTTAPFAFPGDVAVDATLLDGPIDDLNVMTRRSRCRHRVYRHRLTTTTTLAPRGEIVILVAIGAGLELRTDAATATLAPKDTLVLERDDVTTIIATPQAAADLFVIEIAYGDAPAGATSPAP